MPLPSFLSNSSPSHYRGGYCPAYQIDSRFKRLRACCNLAIWLCLVSSLSACSLFPSSDDSLAEGSASAGQAQTSDAEVQETDPAGAAEGQTQEPDSQKAPADNVDSNPKKPGRLPTLREQMRSIEERQAAMQSDIKAMRSDMADVKADVADLRRLMQDSPLVSRIPNATGDKPVNQDAEGNPSVNKDSETFLLPDEPAAVSTGDAVDLLQADSAEDLNTPGSDSENSKIDVTTLQPDPPAGQTSRKFDEPRSLATAIQPDQRIVNPPVFPPTYFNALNLIRSREYVSATDSLLQVLNNTEDPFVRAKTQRWLGEAYYGAQNWKESIEYFRDFLATDTYPEEVQAVLILLGNANVKLGETDEARKYFQQLVDTYPDGELVARARRMLQIL